MIYRGDFRSWKQVVGNDKRHRIGGIFDAYGLYRWVIILHWRRSRPESRLFCRWNRRRFGCRSHCRGCRIFLPRLWWYPPYNPSVRLFLWVLRRNHCAAISSVSNRKNILVQVMHSRWFLQWWLFFSLCLNALALETFFGIWPAIMYFCRDVNIYFFV